MRIRTFILIVLKAALIAFAVAQSSVAKTTPDVAATGSVTGHVFLPESNLPARFANVALQQVGMKPQAGRGSGSEDAARESGEECDGWDSVGIVSMKFVSG